MAIKFKVIEKGQPGIAGNGTKKFITHACKMHSEEPKSRMVGKDNIKELKQKLDKLIEIYPTADLKKCRKSLDDLQ